MDARVLPLIVAAAAITFGTRLAGFGLGDRRIPDAFRRFLGFVPIAAFAALVAPGLSGTTADLVPRLAAAGAAAFAVLRFGRLWACLVVGMTVFWLTRWLL
jgi:branched-subunit amino acid transport protein